MMANFRYFGMSAQGGDNRAKSARAEDGAPCGLAPQHITQGAATVLADAGIARVPLHGIEDSLTGLCPHELVHATRLKRLSREGLKGGGDDATIVKVASKDLHNLCGGHGRCRKILEGW